MLRQSTELASSPSSFSFTLSPYRILTVFGHDHWGHGLSGGHRGDVEDLNYLIGDLKQLIAAQRDNHRGVPFFIIGS